jgi:hypothetical protein
MTVTPCDSHEPVTGCTAPTVPLYSEPPSLMPRSCTCTLSRVVRQRVRVPYPQHTAVRCTQCYSHEPRAPLVGPGRASWMGSPLDPRRPAHSPPLPPYVFPTRARVVMCFRSRADRSAVTVVRSRLRAGAWTTRTPKREGRRRDLSERRIGGDGPSSLKFAARRGTAAPAGEPFCHQPWLYTSAEAAPPRAKQIADRSGAVAGEAGAGRVWRENHRERG